MSIKESLKNLLTWKKTGEDFSKAAGNNVSKEFENCLFGKEASKPILNQAVGKIKEKIILTGPTNGLAVSNMLDLKDVAEALKKHTGSNSSFCKDVCPVLEKTGKWFGFVVPMGKPDFENLEIANKELEKLIKELRKYLDEAERSKIKLKNFEDANTVKVALTVYLIAIMEESLENNLKIILPKKAAGAAEEKSNVSEINKYRMKRDIYNQREIIFEKLSTLVGNMESAGENYEGIDSELLRYKVDFEKYLGRGGIRFDKTEKFSNSTKTELFASTGKDSFTKLASFFNEAKKDCENAKEICENIIDYYSISREEQEKIKNDIIGKMSILSKIEDRFSVNQAPYTGVVVCSAVGVLYSKQRRTNKIPAILQKMPER